jgi:hypothetical protein
LPAKDDQERQTAKLRLASARRRIRALLSEIGTLEGSDFPHPDAESALQDIKRHFLAHLDNIAEADDFSLRTIQAICLNVAMQAELYLPVLGFILRSTNVRNAFELYDPLKHVVERTIGQDAKLIISSEWDFVPFTYPLSLDVLPKYVLVGGPATESANPLLVPLAGHEIGHSAWKHHELASTLEKPLTDAINKILAEHPTEAAELEEDFGPDYIGEIRDIAFKQLEEVYCDIFGLFLFGESYAFAYEYYMFPGGEVRSLSYPPDEDRISYIAEASKWAGIALSKDVFVGWKRSPDDPDGDANMDFVVDRALRTTVPGIFEHVQNLLMSVGVPRTDEAATRAIAESFGMHIPHKGGGNLADVITAGWRSLRGKGGLSADDGAVAELSVLKEVMLKTIEVQEYNLRVGVC